MPVVSNIRSAVLTALLGVAGLTIALQHNALEGAREQIATLEGRSGTSDPRRCQALDRPITPGALAGRPARTVKPRRESIDVPGVMRSSSDSPGGEERAHAGMEEDRNPADDPPRGEGAPGDDEGPAALLEARFDAASSAEAPLQAVEHGLLRRLAGVSKRGNDVLDVFCAGSLCRVEVAHASRAALDGMTELLSSDDALRGELLLETTESDGALSSVLYLARGESGLELAR